MKENNTDSMEKRNVLFCPLLSIGNEILQPCIAYDCAWWVEYWGYDNKHTIKGCALQVLPWVTRD